MVGRKTLLELENCTSERKCYRESIQKVGKSVIGLAEAAKRAARTSAHSDIRSGRLHACVSDWKWWRSSKVLHIFGITAN